MSGSPAVPPRDAVLQVDPLPDSSGLGAIGELSMNTRSVWQQARNQLVERRTDVLHVDLSRVRFLDVAGVTDLAVTAQHLPEGQRIVLHRTAAVATHPRAASTARSRRLGGAGRWPRRPTSC
ncbi:hypothetical protein EV567_1858 [Streptomyces sp. BK239]|nr:hypothetical protein EV567_1858 [Streptomyces sp. BK239]